MKIRTTTAISALLAVSFGAVAYASITIGPFTRTTDGAHNNAEVGNRLGMWMDAEYRYGGNKADTKAIAHVKHVADNRFQVDAVISYSEGSVQTLCKVPATEIPFVADLSSDGTLNSYKGSAKNQNCNVMADMSPLGIVKIGVSDCESFCVGGSKEGGHTYSNQDVMAKYKTTLETLKANTGNDLEAEMAKKQAAAAAAAVNPAATPAATPAAAR